MTSSRHHGQWQISATEGHIELVTSKIGLFSVKAHAPIIGGEADWQPDDADLKLLIGIDQAKTGNPLLDPQLRSFIKRTSDGILTFEGSGHVHDDEVNFSGEAWAGTIRVPMSLTGDSAGELDHERDVQIKGSATFTDVSIPLPGFSKVREIDIHITGFLKLTR